MAIAIRFFMVLASDHESPYDGAAPTVACWQHGQHGDAWFEPAGAVAGIGNGEWRIEPDPADQAGTGPMLLYCTAAGADPFVDVAWPGVPGWRQGDDTVAMPIWMSVAGSGGLVPAPGLTPAAAIAIGDSGYSAAPGVVAEPGGVGAAHGWYLYWPAPADVAQAGDVALYCTAAGADPWAWVYPIAPAPAALAAPMAPVAPPTATPTGRGRDVRNDIRDRLLATGSFGAVFLTSPDEYTIPASDAAAASIEPGPGRDLDRWDDEDGEVLVLVEESATLTVLVRRNDPVSRDEAAEQLLQVAKNALDGRSLAGVTMPDKTWISAWKPIPARAPERRYVATVTYWCLVPGWSGHDDNP